MREQAFTNDWHFSDSALAWYIAMHVEALYFMEVWRASDAKAAHTRIFYIAPTVSS